MDKIQEIFKKSAEICLMENIIKQHKRNDKPSSKIKAEKNKKN